MQDTNENLTELEKLTNFEKQLRELFEKQGYRIERTSVRSLSDGSLEWTIIYNPAKT